MAKVNYQREKRLKDLERQRKQEEKRQKKALKAQGEIASTETGEPLLGEPQPEEDPSTTSGL